MQDHKPPSDEELDEWERLVKEHQKYDADPLKYRANTEMRLIAEVRRLRTELAEWTANYDPGA